MTERSFKLALVLGGGNALGAYHAGAYEALHEAGWEPDWVVGTSIGAVNGALIAGNAPADRVARLREFWHEGSSWPWPGAETQRRTTAVAGTLLSGKQGMFGPAGPLGSWWNPDAAAAGPRLFDSKPLAATLARLVDFGRLGAGEPRFCVGTVELETGHERLFDATKCRLTPDHIRASGALLPTFPPVEIDGIAYVDGGFAANLPLDPVLDSLGSEPTLCLAFDLTPAVSARPATLGEAIAKAQDLTFAGQSHRTIDKWQRLYALDPRLREASTTLVRSVYRDQADEVAGKALDFSAASVAQRWAAGFEDAAAIVRRWRDAALPIGRKGLTIVENQAEIGATPMRETA